MSFVRYFYFEAKKPLEESKADIRKQLEADVEAFLRNGGEIKQVAHHETGSMTEEGELVVRWNNKLSKLQEVQADGRVRSVKQRREMLKEKTMNSAFRNKN